MFAVFLPLNSWAAFSVRRIPWPGQPWRDRYHCSSSFFWFEENRNNYAKEFKHGSKWNLCSPRWPGTARRIKKQNFLKCFNMCLCHSYSCSYFGITERHLMEERHIREASTPFLFLLHSASFHTLFLSGYNSYKRLYWLFSEEKGSFCPWDLYFPTMDLCFVSVKVKREMERECEASPQADIIIVDLLASKVRSEFGVLQEAFTVTEDGSSIRIHSGSLGKLQKTQEKHTCAHTCAQLAEDTWFPWRLIRNTQLSTLWYYSYLTQSWTDKFGIEVIKSTLFPTSKSHLQEIPAVCQIDARGAVASKTKKWKENK